MKRTKKLLINGVFLSGTLNGIERYAYEITIRMDKLCQKDEISIVIPTTANNIPEYRNLEVIRLKKNIKSNSAWRMLTLQWFILTHRQYMILDFGNSCLPFAPGIVFLHDIYCEFFPEDFITIQDKFTRLYSRFQYRLIVHLAKKIVTVSEYSKNQIGETFNIDKDKISVVYSSADHISSISSDMSVFDQFPTLAEKPFYFSLGSLSKRKNIKWINEYAKKHPETYFAVSGTGLSTVKIDELEKDNLKNLIFLGYLDDSKVKALMERCKALILPSYYEGFGLTPLEALSCGSQINIARAASLPEIYGNTAHYIDPYNTDVDLDRLLNEPVDDPSEILQKYTYDKAAEQVYTIIKEFF